MKESIHQALKNPALYGIILIVLSGVVFFYVLHVEGQNHLTYDGYLVWNRVADSTGYTLIAGIILSLIGWAKPRNTYRTNSTNTKRIELRKPRSAVDDLSLALVILVCVAIGFVAVVGTVLFFVAFR